MGENSLTEWNRAKEFLDAARRNCDEHDLKTAANRAYFAAERATVAALMQSRQKIPRHHRVIWLVARFLKIDADAYGLLRTLYDLRLQADYGKSSKIAELDQTTIESKIRAIEAYFSQLQKKFYFP